MQREFAEIGFCGAHFVMFQGGTLSSTAGKMSYRVFSDPGKKQWQVWHVTPASAERRKAERRQTASISAEPDKRLNGERRKSGPTKRSYVPADFEDGWLCFESEDGEKRRLAPIPEKWHALPDARLWMLCRIAADVTRR